MYRIETDTQLFTRSKVPVLPLGIRISHRQKLATEPIRILVAMFEIEKYVIMQQAVVEAASVPD
jgi:hypothetical protein